MAAVGVLTLPMIALVLLRPGSGMAQTVGDFTILGAASLAVLGTFTAARRGGPNRRGWLLMTLATSVWAASQLLWTTYGLSRDHVYPFPALPDIGFIGYSLFAVAALLLFPRVAERGVSRLRVILDALVIVASVFALSWVLVLETVAKSTNSGLAHVTSLGYPLADLFVGSFVLALGMRAPSGSRRPWLFLGLGLLVLTITDSTYMSQTSQGDVGLTGTVLAIGWTAAFLLIAVASQLRTTTTAASTRRHFNIVQELLPYVPLVAVVVVTHDRQFRWDDPVLFVNGAVLLVLFLIQQVLIEVEKVQLARGLEDTVTRRSLELSSSEERFRSLTHSSEDAIVARTPQGIVTDWNPAAERIYGYAADEVIGRSIEMFLPSHLREEDHQTLQTFASGGWCPTTRPSAGARTAACSPSL